MGGCPPSSGPTRFPPIPAPWQPFVSDPKHSLRTSLLVLGSKTISKTPALHSLDEEMNVVLPAEPRTARRLKSQSSWYGNKGFQLLLLVVVGAVVVHLFREDQTLGPPQDTVATRWVRMIRPDPTRSPTPLPTKGPTAKPTPHPRSPTGRCSCGVSTPLCWRPTASTAAAAPPELWKRAARRALPRPLPCPAQPPVQQRTPHTARRRVRPRAQQRVRQRVRGQGRGCGQKSNDSSFRDRTSEYVEFCILTGGRGRDQNGGSKNTVLRQTDCQHCSLEKDQCRRKEARRVQFREGRTKNCPRTNT